MLQFLFPYYKLIYKSSDRTQMLKYWTPELAPSEVFATEFNNNTVKP